MIRAIVIEPEYAQARVVTLRDRMTLYFEHWAIDVPSIAFSLATGDVLITEPQGRRSIYATPVFRLWPDNRSFTKWITGYGIVVRLEEDRVRTPEVTIEQVRAMLEICRFVNIGRST